MKRAHLGLVLGVVAAVSALVTLVVVVRLAMGARHAEGRGADGRAVDAGASGRASAQRDEVLSREDCKPAWRRSLQALHALEGRPGFDARGEANALTALLAVPKTAWGDDAGARALAGTRIAACAPDERGAWAVTFRAPSAAPKPDTCGDVVLELARVDHDGKLVAAPVATRAPTEGCAGEANVTLASLAELDLRRVADMNGDGVPEALLVVAGPPLSGLPDVRALVTSRGGAVAPYPGTEGLTLEGAHDEDGDGRPDVVIHYAVDGGYESGCGAPRPWEYSPPLIGFTASDGALVWNDAKAREVARRACPSPPDPEKDAFCALVWGFEGRGMPDYSKLEARCVADHAEDDARAREPGGGCGLPSRTECSYLGVWSALVEAKLPMTLWPPPAWDVRVRTEAENAELRTAGEAFARARAAMAGQRWNDAVAAYQEARACDEPDVVAAELAYSRLRAGDASSAATQLREMVDRIVDTRVRASALYNLGLAESALGDKRSAARAFFRSLTLRPTSEARTRLGSSQVCPVDAALLPEPGPSLAAWKEGAGAAHEKGDPRPATGDVHEEVASNDRDFVVMTAYRYPGTPREVPYKLDAETGRVVRCLVARGCECTPDAPCTRGLLPAPPAARELAVFAADGEQLVARATWPGDADPAGELRFEIAGGELRVTGLACDVHVKLAQ